MDTTTVLLLALAWPLASLAVGVLVGRTIRARDETQSPPSREE